MAKYWLKRAEQYRRTAVEYSCITANMFMGAIISILGFVIYFISIKLSIVIMVIALIFILFSIILLLKRYYFSDKFTYLDKLSCQIAEIIPILKISHLKSWPEVQEVINNKIWIKEIQFYSSYRYLKTYFNYLNMTYYN